MIRPVSPNILPKTGIGKFWQDTAIPLKVEVDPYDHTRARGYIYRLEDRVKLLGLGV